MDTSSYDILVPYMKNRAVQVDFSLTRYQRIAHPQPSVESTIEQTWQKAITKTPSLFNASKFRLADCKTSPNDPITFQLGLTDYKTYVGTHCFPSQTLHTNRFARQHMARPIGNVTIINTVDQYTVLLVRCQQGVDFPGALASPGGHPEPSQLSSPPLKEGDPRVLELLASAARDEVLEETFLNDSHVPPASSFTFLGVVERAYDGKSSIAYYTKLFATKSQVEHLYQSHKEHNVESDSLLCIPIQQLRKFPSSSFFKPGSQHETLPIVPELRGAAQLWSDMIDNENS